MTRYKFNICDKEFSSKKSVLDYVRENIYSKYRNREYLSDEHLKFMVGLLRYHQWSDQKIGIGISKMWIQPSVEFPTRGFWLERIDGTKTDFSFIQCVSPSSPLRDFKSACRYAIAPIIIDFRQRYFGNKETMICPILANPMTLYTSHVDHAPPLKFEDIVSEFIAVKSINVEIAPLLNHNDGKIGNRFANSEFEKEWVVFHNARANLRVISIEANLKGLQ